MAEKSPIPLTSLKLPLTLAQVRTVAQDGSTVMVILEIDAKGKLNVFAETPPEP